MLHTFKLYKEPFYAIKNGTKTIELRLYDEKRQLISIGDTIIFQLLDNNRQSLEVRVIALYIFSSFEDLYNSLPLEKCGYAKEAVKNASYHDMEKYYSFEMQEKYGVIGIEFIKV